MYQNIHFTICYYYFVLKWIIEFPLQKYSILCWCVIISTGVFIVVRPGCFESWLCHSYNGGTWSYHQRMLNIYSWRGLNLFSSDLKIIIDVPIHIHNSTSYLAYSISRCFGSCAGAQWSFLNVSFWTCFQVLLAAGDPCPFYSSFQFKMVTIHSAYPLKIDRSQM